MRETREAHIGLRPEWVEVGARNLFEMGVGVGGQEGLDAWNALPEGVRQQWRDEAVAKYADYVAMSPAERERQDRAAMATTVRINDARIPISRSERDGE